jgi:SET domain-containing protein
MLLIPTYLAPSRIAGIGLFTAVHIPHGRTIWLFDEHVDWRLTGQQLAAFPDPFREQLRHWCYEEVDGRYVLCGDNAKFMNHSFEPNCDDPGGIMTVAGRDIEANEELTSDYRTFDAESARSGLLEWRGRAGTEPVALVGQGSRNGRGR